MGDGFEGDDAGGLAEVVDGEVVGGAVEPAAGFSDVGELGVQPHEGFLDGVLGRFAVAEEALRVGEQGRFERGEEFLDRLGCCAGFLGAGHGHLPWDILFKGGSLFIPGDNGSPGHAGKTRQTGDP